MNRNELISKYGNYINNYPWEWYAILTFKNTTSYKGAFYAFNRWKVALKKSTGNFINYFLVIQYKRFDGDIPHLHVFISGVGNEKPSYWQQEWYSKYGWAQIEPYDSSKHACYYLSNQWLNDEVDVKFSKLFNIQNDK